MIRAGKTKTNVFRISVNWIPKYKEMQKIREFSIEIFVKLQVEF
jgi:hypothetical protein